MTETIDDIIDEELLDDILPSRTFKRSCKRVGDVIRRTSVVLGGAGAFAYPLVLGSIKGYHLDSPIPDEFGTTEYGAVAAVATIGSMTLAAKEEDRFGKSRGRFSLESAGVCAIASPVLHAVGYIVGAAGRIYLAAADSAATLVCGG